MQQIYILLLIFPLLSNSLEVHPTCPSKIHQSKCLQEKLLSILFKPHTNTDENFPHYSYNGHKDLIYTKSQEIEKPTVESNGKAHNKTLERGKSFSRKTQKGFWANLKNIPQNTLQQIQTFGNKVISLPIAVRDAIWKLGARTKDFIITDVPEGINKLKMKVLLYYYGLPKDLAEVEMTVKGIPNAIVTSLKAAGEKVKRMLTLKTVNGTTVLREKINNLPNQISKGAQKIREKWRILHNSLSNGYKNLKDKTKRALQGLWDLPLNLTKVILNAFSGRVYKMIGLGIGIMGCYIGIKNLYVFYCEWKRRRAGQVVPLPEADVLAQD